jgi:hypothetical protein
MINNALKILKSIDDSKQELKEELAALEKSGNARLFHWMDKYDSYVTWVISDNKDLLSKIYIDGWSDDNGYGITGEERTHLPRDHPELIRIEVWRDV